MYADKQRSGPNYIYFNVYYKGAKNLPQSFVTSLFPIKYLGEQSAHTSG